MLRASGTRLAGDVSLWKRKRIHRVAGGDRHVLTTVDRIADRRRSHVGARLEVPQMLAGPSVECDEVAVSYRAEHDISRGGQNAVGQRGLKDLEIPHRLAGFGIDCLDARRR